MLHRQVSEGTTGEGLPTDTSGQWQLQLLGAEQGPWGILAEALSVLAIVLSAPEVWEQHGHGLFWGQGQEPWSSLLTGALSLPSSSRVGGPKASGLPATSQPFPQKSASLSWGGQPCWSRKTAGCQQDTQAWDPGSLTEKGHGCWFYGKYKHEKYGRVSSLWSLGQYQPTRPFLLLS